MDCKLERIAQLQDMSPRAQRRMMLHVGDITEEERRAHFCEPCVEGFEHVVEAADDSAAEIIRHLRREEHSDEA